MPITDSESKSAEELIRWCMDQYGLKAGLACSFGMEDMILIDIIAKLKGPITIFTLDTGRLHEETYEIMDRVKSHYGLEIKTYLPNLEQVENLVREKGFFSFKENIENLLEVSIGHALITESLYFGLENTIKKYLEFLS